MRRSTFLASSGALALVSCGGARSIPVRAPSGREFLITTSADIATISLRDVKTGINVLTMNQSIVNQTVSFGGLVDGGTFANPSFIKAQLLQSSGRRALSSRSSLSIDGNMATVNIGSAVTSVRTDPSSYLMTRSDTGVTTLPFARIRSGLAVQQLFVLGNAHARRSTSSDTGQDNGAGDNGPGGNPNGLPMCDDTYSQVPCTLADGSVVIGITSTLGSMWASGAGAGDWGAPVLAAGPPGSIASQLQCTAGVIGAELATVGAAIQSILSALTQAAGGTFTLQEFLALSQAEQLALVTDAIAVLGLGDVLIILGAGISVFGLLYALWTCQGA